MASYVHSTKQYLQTNSNNGILNIFSLNEEKDFYNIVLFGVDKDEIRTDVILLCSVDLKNSKVNVLSIPRDTRVTVDEEVYEKLKYKEIRANRSVKINEIHAYAGTKNANKVSVLQIEKLLGIKVDSFVKINIKAFREIVDLVGGVEVDVPMNMYYIDPVQDLYINLKKGTQTLNGSRAEQFVRFRKGMDGSGYARGDIQRIEVQQEFLKSLISKLMSEAYSITGLKDIAKTAYEYVETDMTITEMYKYIKFIPDFEFSSVNFETLPGYGVLEGNISYYQYDPIATQKIVKNLFTDEKLEKVSINHKIEILNGSNKAGLAAHYQKKLVKQGYTVSRIGNYRKTSEEFTKIIVRDETLGKDLQRFFGISDIEVNSSLLEEEDIRIILGLNETK